jgi:hypothetical protein
MHAIFFLKDRKKLLYTEMNFISMKTNKSATTHQLVSEYGSKPKQFIYKFGFSVSIYIISVSFVNIV